MSSHPPRKGPPPNPALDQIRLTYTVQGLKYHAVLNDEVTAVVMNKEFADWIKQQMADNPFIGESRGNAEVKPGRISEIEIYQIEEGNKGEPPRRKRVAEPPPPDCCYLVGSNWVCY